LKERRKAKREKLVEYLNVYTQEIANAFGQLMNVTPQGILLRIDQKIPRNENYNFTLNIPRRLFGNREIALKARSVWCSQSDDSKYFHVGFQIENLSDTDFDALRGLLSKFERVQ